MNEISPTAPADGQTATPVEDAAVGASDSPAPGSGAEVVDSVTETSEEAEKRSKPLIPLNLRFQMQALAPVIGVLIAGFSARDFILEAASGNMALDGLIFACAVFGMVIMMVRLVEAQREHGVMLRFAHEVETNGADMTELLASAAWLRGRMAKRFLDHIAQTGGKLASQLDQQAIESEIKAMDEEFESKLELPGFLVGFMIALGLLGTFIGLLETLTGISHMLDGISGQNGGAMEQEFMKLVGELKKPLAGMGIAFAASLFGLVGSLVLGVMQLAVRRNIKVVMHDARAITHRLTERVRHPVGGNGMGGNGAGGPVGTMAMPAFPADGGIARGGVSEAFLRDFFGELVNGINQMQEVSHRSQEAQLQVSTRIDGLARRLDSLVSVIERSVDATKRTNDLLGFGPRMKETSEETLGEIRNLGSSMADMVAALTRNGDMLSNFEQRMQLTGDAQREQAKVLTTVNRDAVAKLEEAIGLLQNLTDHTQEADSKADRGLKAVATSIGNSNTKLDNLLVQLSEIASATQSQLSSATQVQQAGRESTNTLLAALKEVSSQIGKLNEVSTASSRNIYSVKEGLAPLGQSNETLGIISQSIDRLGTLIEMLTEEGRTNSKNMVRDLRTEFRDLVREQRTDLQRLTEQMMQAVATAKAEEPPTAG